MSGSNGHRGAQRARAVVQRSRSNVLPLPPRSGNAMMIRKLMASRAMRGNPRNYVVIIGSQLIDCSGTYSAILSEGGKVFGDVVALVHKRELAEIIGEKAALRFWDPVEGRVDAPAQPGATDVVPDNGGAEADR